MVRDFFTGTIYIPDIQPMTSKQWKRSLLYYSSCPYSFIIHHLLRQLAATYKLQWSTVVQ